MASGAAPMTYARAMPRVGAKRRADVKSPADPSARVLRAAERCIAVHGIRKTTMEDIANEAGMSRPTVYRYFADRDELLVALISQHSHALGKRAHQFIERQPSFGDQLVEGLLFIADHGSRDPFTRHLVQLDGSQLSRKMTESRSYDRLTAEFWDPFLDKAAEDGRLVRNLDRADAHLWLGSVGLMLMRLLDDDRSEIERYRRMLRSFVVPAFVR